jgi:hypothetical protein
MRGKKARKLRRAAEAATVGYTKEATRHVYKKLKKNAK